MTSGEQSIRKYFEAEQPRLAHIAGQLVAEPDAMVEAASRRWDERQPDLAYVDEPDHPMASSFLLCAAHLMLFLELREHHGTDAHTYGRAMHAVPRGIRTDVEQAHPREFRRAAVESMTTPVRGRFQFEFVDTGGPGWAMNIRSCALCHEFGRNDAIDLVPYFCHNDDVASDEQGLGLRRTGTIAVGASHCDFRYGTGEEPLRISDRYPDAIRLDPPTVRRT